MGGTEEIIFQKSLRSGGWMLLNTLFARALDAAAFLLLARVLDPRDFGVLAIAMMTAATLDTLTTPGLGQAIIQKHGEVTSQLDSVWTFEVLRGFFVSCLLYFSAPWIAQFFATPEAAPAIQIWGIVYLIQALANIGQLFFFKEINFKLVFYRDLPGHLLYPLVTLAIAIHHPSFWALIYGKIAQNVSGCLMSYWLHPYRPRLRWKWTHIREHLGFGGWVMGQNLVQRLSDILDNSFVGYLLGPSALGYYSKARGFAFLPTSPLYHIVFKVGFPAYAKLQQDLERVREAFLKSMDIILMVSLPFATCVFFLADDLILLLLGSKWLAMSMPLKLLVLAVPLRSMLHACYPLFQGTGQPQTYFKLGAFQLLTTFLLLLALAPQYSVVGTCLAVLLSHAATLLLALVDLKRCSRISISQLLPPCATITLATLLLGCLLYAARRMVPSISPGALAVLPMFAGAYLLFLRTATTLLRTSPYKTLTSLLSSL